MGQSFDNAKTLKYEVCDSVLLYNEGYVYQTIVSLEFTEKDYMSTSFLNAQKVSTVFSATEYTNIHLHKKRNLERNISDRLQTGLIMFQISGFVFHVYFRTCKSAVRLKLETNYQRIRGDGRKKENETDYESENNGNKYPLMTKTDRYGRN